MKSSVSFLTSPFLPAPVPLSVFILLQAFIKLAKKKIDIFVISSRYDPQKMDILALKALQDLLALQIHILH